MKRNKWITGIVIIVTILLLQSCGSQWICRQSLKYCPSKTIDSIIVKRDTIYRDTTIFIYFPQDTLRMEIPIEVPGKPISIPRVSKTTGIITAEAWIKYNRLYINAFISDSGIFYSNDSLLREITVLEKQLTEKVYAIDRPYIPDIFKYAFLLSIVAIIGGLFYIYLKLKK